MVECSVCNDSFETEHGKNIHRSQVHGKPQNECKNCGESFEIPRDNKDQKFCSSECYLNYSNIKVECYTCGDSFEVRRSRYENRNRLYCSTDCVDFSGEENPFYNKTHKNLSDKMPSGEDHWMYGRERPEHAKKMSERHSGKDNPMYGVRGKDAPAWEGGDSMKQAWRRRADWFEARCEALERDNFECQDCGISENLHVHHIEPVSEGGAKFDTKNLITLCQEHHYEKH
jgi:hypothetical protein